MSMMELELRNIQQRRLRRHARLFAKRNGYDLTPDQLEEFCDRAVVEEAAQFEGPFVDLIQKLIADFIENPDKWIAIIKIIISLF